MALNPSRILRRLQRNIVCHLTLRSRWCSSLLRPAAPIRLRNYPCASSPACRLIVFLPGIGDILEDYEFYGFIDAIRRCRISADMIAADMHFGYYLRRTAIERLREDVIVPAQRKGYGEIDLVGISLGGFGALYYAMHHPGEIARLFLLAPYLGEQPVVREICTAGGVKKWQPANVADADYERKLWLWLKSYDRQSPTFPSLYLGYGLQDKFASANQLLADRLPGAHVHRIPGKHDWPTWIRLWHAILAQIEPSSAAAGPRSA